jgi:hypothetical protein
VAKASSPAQVRHLIDRAARIALSRRTVMIIPNDLCRRTSRSSRQMSIALTKDDPDEAGVIRGVARQVLETVLPGKE